jgi:peptidoglycan/xylan/chitin deacetylase (PgdA/CDA1 family)
MSMGNNHFKKFRSTVKRLLRALAALPVFVTDQALISLGRILGIRTPSRRVAIYYHQVSAENRSRLAWQMDHLLRWAKPIRVEDWDSTSPQSRDVLVTADDGWLSFVENALPELAQRKIPLTFFIVSHQLGDNLAGDNHGDPDDRLLSESELGNLPRDLVTVGSHTATHARLPTASDADVRRELIESRVRLSGLCGADVNLFCFPFSDYDERSIELCRSCGYVRAFGSQLTPAISTQDSFLVERIRVDPTDWPIEFHLKLMNAYRLVFAATKLRRRIGAAISAKLSLTKFAPESELPYQRVKNYPPGTAKERYSDASN